MRFDDASFTDPDDVSLQLKAEILSEIKDKILIDIDTAKKLIDDVSPLAKQKLMQKVLNWLRLQ